MVLAAGDRVHLYGSDNLTTWVYLSDFSPAHTIPGVLECPDLFELPVEGKPDERHWILKVDSNTAPLCPGSGSHYFVGDFDGTQFTTRQIESRRVDYGADFYASQSWSDVPDGRRIWIAWMSNWQYALFVPTQPWRGAISLPRQLSLARLGDDITLLQRPAPELEALRHCRLLSVSEEVVNGESSLLDSVSGDALEVVARIELEDASRVGLRVRAGMGMVTEIVYDVDQERLYLDRSRSGAFFSERFSGLQAAPLSVPDGVLELQVFVDWSSLEVFAEGGRAVMTDLIFPDPESRGLGLFAQGGAAKLLSLEVYTLASIWSASPPHRSSP